MSKELLVIIIYIAGILICIIGLGIISKDISEEELNSLKWASIFWVVALPIGILCGIVYLLFHLGKYIRDRYDDRKEKK